MLTYYGVAQTRDLQKLGEIKFKADNRQKLLKMHGGKYAQKSEKAHNIPKRLIIGALLDDPIGNR